MRFCQLAMRGTASPMVVVTSRAESVVYFGDLRYVNDTRRYDTGERDHFISMGMAAIGMEMMADWGALASFRG